MFVGREDELNLLRERVRMVAEGHGGAVWLTGEPGIGKSTLIAAALAQAEQEGCRVFSAAALEHSTYFPFGAILDAVGARGELGMSPTSTKTLLSILRRQCAVAPAILVIDDAQWADDASLAFVERLSALHDWLPLLRIVSARPVPLRPVTVACGQALVAAGALSLDLGSLSAGEVAELARQHNGRVPNKALTTLLDGAGGNPLFVRDLLDAVARESRPDPAIAPASMPDTLASTIRRRLCYLTEPTLALLRLAAILGLEFTVTDLGVVTRQPHDEFDATLGEAVTAGILTENEPTHLAFRHALVHRALYQSMPGSLRAAVHHQIAESLARARKDAEVVAAHLLAAPEIVGSWESDWITESAAALTLRAPRAAVDLIWRALHRVDAQDPRRERLESELAMAELMLGHDEAVVRICSVMQARTRDPAMAGRLAWTLAHALTRLGRLDEALAVTSCALGRADLPGSWSSRVRARYAMSLVAIGRNADARAAAERAEREGREAGDHVAVGHALYASAMVELHHRGEAAVCVDLTDQALEVLGDDPHTADLVLLLTASRGAALNLLGASSEADRQFDRTAAVAVHCTEPVQAQAHVLSAVHLWYRGRWDEALAQAEAAASLPLDRAYRLSISGVAAQVALHRDDREVLTANARSIEQVALLDTETRALVEFQLVAWARAAERDRKPGEALTRLLAIFDPAGTLEFPNLCGFSCVWLSDVVRLALTVDAAAVAHAAARAGAREANLRPTPVAKASVQHCQGLLDADPSAALAAAQIYQSVGIPLFRAAALEDAAVLHAERNELDRARTAYLNAIDIYRHLGATWDMMRADARLRPHKIRRGARGSRCRPSVGWEALTQTEQKIANLIVAGRSNPDIAHHMLVSRYTVESHVSHILKKLSARSRVEIARAAAQH